MAKTATKAKGKVSKGTVGKGNGLPNNGKQTVKGLQVICRVVVTPLGSRARGVAVTVYKGGTVGAYCTRVNVKSGKVVTWQGYKNLPLAKKAFANMVAAFTKAGC